jgi:hypothetical protein
LAQGSSNFKLNEQIDDLDKRVSDQALQCPGPKLLITFKHNPFGRRIYKSASAGTSVYAYDGDNLVEETRAAGAVVARYSQGLQNTHNAPFSKRFSKRKTCFTSSTAYARRSALGWMFS